MKLYIKQKVFSWKSKFTIKDEREVDRYFVEGEIFSLENRLHISDANNNEIALVKKKLFAFLPKFEVYKHGGYIATIEKEFTFFQPKYRINGMDLAIEGDVFSHNYVIKEQERIIASVKKAWFSWGDSYEVDILDTADEVMLIAIVLAIDCVMDSSNNNNNNHHNHHNH